MSANLLIQDIQYHSQEQDKVIDSALDLIMPSWPLDQSVAVNPWHSQTDKNFLEVLQTISSISNAQMIIPSEIVHALVSKPDHDVSIIQSLLNEHDLKMEVNDFLSWLKTDRELRRIKLLPQLVDELTMEGSDLWSELIVDNIAHECADYYTNLNGNINTQQEGLFASWLRKNRFDYSIEFQSGENGIVSIIRSLPENAETMIHYALQQIGLENEFTLTYIQSLLHSILGWSSYAAYLKWMSKFDNHINNDLRELLAIRLAWEMILLEKFKNKNLLDKLHKEFQSFDEIRNFNSKTFALNKVCIMLLEHDYQQNLISDLKSNLIKKESKVYKPTAQMVFCIDVRSERIRRAIESVDNSIETKGFAGFFGLSIGYVPNELEHTYRLLPALISPNYKTKDIGENSKYNIESIKINSVKDYMFRNSFSMFSSVEIFGLRYGIKLFNQFFLKKTYNQSYQIETPRKKIICTSSGQPISNETTISLAASILKAMSFTKDFASIVAIIGHGSECQNNPHNATLNCGACGGQSGEVNAQLLVDLLNDASIRMGLMSHGICIPNHTLFIAGLHNTTTDAIDIINQKSLPHTKNEELLNLQKILFNAQEKVLKERTKQFREYQHYGASIKSFYLDKAKSPSQVRPEWGLINNAAFIIGPRECTKNLNFSGRAFMHDYLHQDDENATILGSIMTAPMVVASWINLQYFASTVDNNYYGSGNKLLHNVVGGTIGVIEGSSGDLRIGLPWQSVHDGDHYMHTPIRLNVIVYAKKQQIMTVLNKNPSIKNLFDNQWLHLFHVDIETSQISQYASNTWSLF